MNYRLKDEHARNFHGSFADDAEMVGESEQSGGNVEGDNVDYSTEEGDVEEAGMSPVSPRFAIGGLVEAGFKEGGRPSICVCLYVYTHNKLIEALVIRERNKATCMYTSEFSASCRLVKIVLSDNRIVVQNATFSIKVRQRGRRRT